VKKKNAVAKYIGEFATTIIILFINISVAKSLFAGVKEGKEEEHQSSGVRSEVI
jgi:hypothetical protein